MKYIKLLIWLAILGLLVYGCFYGFNKFKSGEWLMHKVPIVQTIDELAR